MSKLYVVLHGGLGNQLFQYFYSRLALDAFQLTSLCVVSDFLRDYDAPREIELEPLIESTQAGAVFYSTPSALLRMRLPKVLNKLTGLETPLVIPAFGVIVDGYFQKFNHYRNVSEVKIASELAIWRKALRSRLSLDQLQQGRLLHIRLGDFFHDLDLARTFTAERLAAIRSPTDVITDQEELVIGVLRDLQVSAPVRVVSTSNMPAWDLMQLMCRYESISTNGSTLAYWASVLCRAELLSTNPEHMKIWRRTMAMAGPSAV